MDEKSNPVKSCHVSRGRWCQTESLGVVVVNQITKTKPRPQASGVGYMNHRYPFCSTWPKSFQYSIVWYFLI